mmetsp:Transcript_35740/g.64831  ORF Transcript_35740/g.64831 Transcript_35740/m.64831 type:complete len:904 (+) Transcript_35740:3-2714(+)
MPVPGIPQLRWVYSTRPVFWAMDPAHLTFLSGGLLTPELYHYRISLMDLTCTEAAYQIPMFPSAADLAKEDMKDTLVGIYQQIAKALRSDGWATGQELRGQLFLLDPEHELKPHENRYWKFEEQTEGNWTMVQREHTTLDELMDTALILSFTVGFLVSILSSVFLYRLCQHELRAKIMHKRALQAVLARKLGESKEEKPMTDTEKQAQGNPLLHPLLLVDSLLLEPLQARLINALARFCNEVLIVNKADAPPDPVSKKAAAVTPIAHEFDDKAAAEEDERIKSQLADVEEGSAAPKPASAWPSSTAAPLQRFVYMREFRTRFEEWCIDRGLENSHSRDHVVRFLVDQYNIRSTRETVWRMRGVKWRDPSKAPAPKPAFATGEEEETNTIFQFCNEMIEKTANRRKNWIDVKNGRTPGGKLQIGFEQRYLNWCDTKALDTVEPLQKHLDPLEALSEKNGLQAWATQHKVSFQEVEVQKLCRCELRAQPKIVLNWQAQVYDIFQVIVHICVLLGPSAMVMSAAMAAQHVYATTLVTEPPLRVMDVLGTFAPYIGMDAGGKKVMYLVQAIFLTQFFYILLSLVRVMLHYLARGFKVKKYYDIIYAVVLFVNILGILTWAGLTGAWCMLATVLEPTRFLPYGTAVIVFIVVVITLFRELTAMAGHAQKRCFETINGKLQGALLGMKEAIEVQLHEEAIDKLRLRRTGGALATKAAAAEKKKVDESTALFEHHEKKQQRKVTPSDLFKVLDVDQTGTLSMDEFRKLFDAMQGQIAQKDIEKMFAYADADGSGLVCIEEFEAAWSYMVEGLVSRALKELGFSPTDIAIAILISCAVLVCLFMFIFFAMQGWFNDTNIQACVQSGLVGLSGKLATSVRQRAPGENDNSVEALMSQIEEVEDDGDGDGDGE